jgi:4-hydroxy-3-methylbut-2-enyl diphosphate reductase
MSIEAWALRSGLLQAQVVQTGAGRKRSQNAARSLRDSPAEAFAVAGVCGALESDLAPGDVVIASSLSSADGERELESAEPLARAVAHIGLSARIGKIRSEDRVVRGNERERLRELGAIAVDMESQWLADAAGDRPLAVLRVVLDAPNQELFHPRVFPNLVRALSRLRRAAPALEAWSNRQTPSPQAKHSQENY